MGYLDKALKAITTEHNKEGKTPTIALNDNNPSSSSGYDINDINDINAVRPPDLRERHPELYTPNCEATGCEHRSLMSGGEKCWLHAKHVPAPVGWRG